MVNCCSVVDTVICWDAVEADHSASLLSLLLASVAELWYRLMLGTCPVTMFTVHFGNGPGGKCEWERSTLGVPRKQQLRELVRLFWNQFALVVWTEDDNSTGAAWICQHLLHEETKGISCILESGIFTVVAIPAHTLRFCEVTWIWHAVMCECWMHTRMVLKTVQEQYTQLRSYCECSISQLCLRLRNCATRAKMASCCQTEDMSNYRCFCLLIIPKMYYLRCITWKQWAMVYWLLVLQQMR